VPSFAQRIINWQLQHGRHGLPWQGADAYCVWLSEIMLQQTQVATVIPYYQRFVASFPDIGALAAANEDDILSHWSGLGYYSRARNLHRAAQRIMQQHDGNFPHDFDAIIALPGIGRSTAAAISALAFRQHRAILDGNVKRVLARYCAIEGFTGDRKVEAQLWQQAEALLPMPDSTPLPAKEITGDWAVVVGQPGRTGRELQVKYVTPAQAGVQFNQALDSGLRRNDQSGVNQRFLSSSIRDRERNGSNESISTYTQGLMDLGATICTRSKPDCEICPVQKDCRAYRSGRVAQLPSPRPRKMLPEKHSTFLLLMHGNDILLEKRPGSGIWGGLWCPPQFEDVQAAFDEFARMGIAQGKTIQHSRAGGKTSPQGEVSRNGYPANSTYNYEALPTFTHSFTHFRLHIAPLLIHVMYKPMQIQEPGRLWLDVEDALHAAIPTPVRRLLEGIKHI
jgi:A/G-specific adenine glycosylase